MKALLTDRCLLRPLRPEDAPWFYELNEDPEVVRYTGDGPFPGVEEARQFLEAYDQYERFGVGRLAVVDRVGETPLGWCGLRYDPGREEYDIGFRFFRRYWGRGFATETAAACLRWGFRELKLPLIVGRALRENAASIRVLEKIGMRYVGACRLDERAAVRYEAEWAGG